jgi:CRP-like cAMP-binding protein
MRSSSVPPSALRQVSLFATLRPEDLAALTACMRRRPYAKGQFICYQGDPGTSLYIIETGQVTISLTSPEGKELVLNRLGPGEVFGELALLDGEPRSADAVAAELSQLLLLQRADFLQVLEARPGVAITLLGVLSRRLRHLTEVAGDEAFLDVPARLAKLLLALAEPAGQHPGVAAELAMTPRLTQVALAGLLGVTRESIGIWLRRFERQGVLRRERGRILLLRPESLRQRSA